MKKIITLILITFSLASFAQDSLNIKVEISALRSNDGQIRIELFDKDKKVIQKTTANIIDNKASFEINNLPKAAYALRYFHDEDDDKAFGVNYFGIPKEGFGYSNNAKGMFGEPKFKNWLFLLDENKSLLLKASYLF